MEDTLFQSYSHRMVLPNSHCFQKKRKEMKKENGKRPLRRVSYLQGQHYDTMKEVSGGAQVLPVPLPGCRPENVKM